MDDLSHHQRPLVRGGEGRTDDETAAASERLVRLGKACLVLTFAVVVLYLVGRVVEWAS